MSCPLGREGRWEAGLVRGASSLGWVIRSEVGTKNKLGDSPSLPKPGSLFLKVHLLQNHLEMSPFTFVPSSLEGGHFSRHCRNSNSAFKDCPHTPAKGGTHLPGVTIWDVPMVFSMTVFLAQSSRPLPWEELQEWSVAHSNSLKEIILWLHVKFQKREENQNTYLPNTLPHAHTPTPTYFFFSCLELWFCFKEEN